MLGAQAVHHGPVRLPGPDVVPRQRVVEVPRRQASMAHSEPHTQSCPSTPSHVPARPGTPWGPAQQVHAGAGHGKRADGDDPPGVPQVAAAPVGAGRDGGGRAWPWNQMGSVDMDLK